jgi:DNA-directed RNA polymerase specialized sigma24 family protein
MEEPEPTHAEGFERFYARTWRDAVRWATALTGSRTAGEDVAQDAYLRTAVVNGARDARRAHERRSNRELRIVRAERPPTGEPVDTPLLRSLSTLPYDQRAALVLRFWGDWDEAAIATALDCRPATVRSHVKRGLDALRRSLVEQEDLA